MFRGSGAVWALIGPLVTTEMKTAFLLSPQWLRKGSSASPQSSSSSLRGCLVCVWWGRGPGGVPMLDAGLGPEAGNLELLHAGCCYRLLFFLSFTSLFHPDESDSVPHPHTPTPPRPPRRRHPSSLTEASANNHGEAGPQRHAD